jgi:D-alanyl-lipoteichoic acid acyltransferase DltB (MBOAT superfamily)
MLFNSFEFFVFFPLVTIIYFLLPHRYRWFHLLVSSCYFYASFIPVYLLILFGTIVVDYFAGLLIEQSAGKMRRLSLALSIVANVGILAVFKYYNFFIDNINTVSDAALPFLKIALPIGLSFHTFQAMSYTNEVYRGHQKAERHFGIYALYVMFYPQMVAGPIERPQNLLHQFYEKHDFDYDRIVSGLKLMAWGLMKKIVIADRLALYVNEVFGHTSQYAAATQFLAVFFFAFQIYCDFSGYSDIARGAARVMGFELMLNFNSPYFSRSIAEFWKRWHISLSTWFKDYLYIPLGGNRVSVGRHYVNLFFTFLVSGFWHGANWTFIAWGALHGMYLMVGNFTRPYRRQFLNRLKIPQNNRLVILMEVLFVFMLVCLTWIYFRAANMAQANAMVVTILGGVVNGSIFHFSMADILAGFAVTDIIMNFTLILVLLLLEKLHASVNLSLLVKKQHPALRFAVYTSICLTIIFFGRFGSKEFIYFQF